MENEKKLEVMDCEHDDTIMAWNNTCSDCKWFESNGYCSKFGHDVDRDDPLCSYGITRL